MDYQKFYNELGKLLYAVAISDGKIQAKEEQELHQLVREELIKLEESVDEFNLDAAFFTEFKFDFMKEENTKSANELLDAFGEYLKSTPELPVHMRKAARAAAQRIAESFAGINKKEEEFLRRLDDIIEH